MCVASSSDISLTVRSSSRTTNREPSQSLAGRVVSAMAPMAPMAPTVKRIGRALRSFFNMERRMR